MSEVKIIVTATTRNRTLTVAEVRGDMMDAKRLFGWLDGRRITDRWGKPTEATLHVEAEERQPGWTPLDLTEDQL